MEELLERYKELDEVQQQQLLTYANKLILEQKLKHPKVTLADKNKEILDVSVWSDEDIKQMEDNLKLLGQWKALEW